MLPILGYVRNFPGSIYPSFVSPWIENGTLRDYMKREWVDVDILVMVGRNSWLKTIVEPEITGRQKEFHQVSSICILKRSCMQI